MEEKTTTYVPPKIETVDAEEVITSLGPAVATGSGNHHHHHGGHYGGHYGGWGSGC